jgi:Flp pilus assembly protein TadD
VAHGLAGSALLCLGRPAEARRAFEQSLALDPSQARLRELLARDR